MDAEDNELLSIVHYCRNNLRLSWENIADHLNINVSRELYQWRKHWNVDERLEVEALEVGDVSKKVNVEDVDELRILGYTWKLIAEELKVGVKFLYRWKISNSYMDPWNIPLNDELDALVASIVSNHPDRGRNLIMAGLRIRGYK